jgi:hypothetical protein
MRRSCNANRNDGGQPTVSPLGKVFGFLASAEILDKAGGRNVGFVKKPWALDIDCGTSLSRWRYASSQWFVESLGAGMSFTVSLDSARGQAGPADILLRP